MKKEKIQVVRQISKTDKTVIEAKKITEKFKVLSYHESDKLLEKKATNFTLSRAKA